MPYIDTSDLNNLLELMDKYGDSRNSFWSENQNGEPVSISICHDRIIFFVAQANGCARTNTYYRDGTSEEFFNSEGRRCKEGL